MKSLYFMVDVKYLIILGFVLLSLFIISCTPSEKSCSLDSDCLPASCCHAINAVNLENSPDCAGQLCTTECVPGTIDCGQGEIKCVSGSCEAVMHEK
jgi:hypothetical protein